MTAELPTPIAYRSATGHGVYYRETLTPELRSLEFGGRPMWAPMFTEDQMRAYAIDYAAQAVKLERERSKLAVLDAMEECAQIAERTFEGSCGTNEDGVDYMGDESAQAIRERAAAIRSQP